MIAAAGIWAGDMTGFHGGAIAGRGSLLGGLALAYLAVSWAAFLVGRADGVRTALLCYSVVSAAMYGVYAALSLAYARTGRPSAAGAGKKG